jgi:hypothetical protein
MDVKGASHSYFKEEELFEKAMTSRREQQTQVLDAMEKEHQAEIDSTAKRLENEKKEMEHAYKVELSRLENSQKQRLEKTRKGHDKEVDAVKQEQEK